MKIERLRTPALILDEEAFGRNMETMRSLLSGSGVSLRPHYKSHKCAEIARMQISAGAIGITCAKLSEAEDLVDAGIEDVLIANQVVEEVRRHFGAMGFDTIIGRNIRLSEAPSHGKPVILYDASATGSVTYMNLAKEFIKRNRKKQQ